MKSSKKSVSFRIGGGDNARQGASVDRPRPAGELGSTTYEKRYFQVMLARLSQQRPKTSGFCKTNRFQEELPQPRRRPQSGGDIFSQRSKQPAVSSVMEKRRRTKVSSISSSSSSPSSSSLSSSSSPSCSSQLEVVGVRTAMTSRRTPSPSLFIAGSPTPHHGLPTKAKLSRSREILHRIQDELSQAKDHFSDRVLGSQVRPLSRSLNEISNLVMELDNNLTVDPGLNEDGGQEGRVQVHARIPDVCDTAGRRAPPEVKAESLLYVCKIGRGSFAHVFKAKLFETAVALKEFKEDEDGSSGRRRCLREADQLSRIRHPNLANLIAVCHEKNALVLELVDGEALGALLKRERFLDGDGILAVCRDVLLALHYLHNVYPESVIHLDVKSNNVLLSGVGGSAISAKLCDFGSARRLPGGMSEILLGGVTGTPAWMSPEVIQQAHVGVKADVYSFGVMLWEMLSGEVPYDGMELQEVCGSICRGGHPISRPDFHVRLPGVCRLLERCWELCPAARPDCGQLVAKLAKIRDAVDLGSAVPSPPPLPPPPMPHARLPQPEGQMGSPEQKRPSTATGFNVTREDLEAQRLRLRRTEEVPPNEHEADIEAASSSMLSHIMKKAIRERRTDSGWGQQDSSNAGDSRGSNCQSPWSEETDDPSSR